MNAISSGQPVNVRFGNICYQLACANAEVFEKLNAALEVFRTDAPADIAAELRVVDRLDTARMDADPSLEKIEPGAGRAYFVEYDAAGRKLVATVEPSLLNGASGLRPLNSFFRLIYYTATRLMHPDGLPWMLVHSCAIIRDGEVLLFTGPSETGKTTVGRLCGEDYGSVLNDEMVLMSWPRAGNGAPMVRNAPILGELPFRLDTAAPLRRVFLLKQGRRTSLRRLDGMEAYRRFLRQVVSPLGFLDRDKRAIVSILDAFAGGLIAAVPFYELEFTRDRNLMWDIEDRLAELVGTGALYG